LHGRPAPRRLTAEAQTRAAWGLREASAALADLLGDWLRIKLDPQLRQV
jgi:hypothetical protein